MVALQTSASIPELGAYGKHALQDREPGGHGQDENGPGQTADRAER